MPQALDGITVVDFSHVVAGPLATHFLALNGARVIKIESPQGDPLRNYTAKPKEQGNAPAFQGINLGKESVVLDLKSPEGKKAALDLVAQADIAVENFRPGVMARLGLDFGSIQAQNPDLIYCSISGFGQSGAMSDVAAIDQIVQSLSGLMHLSGQEGDPAQRVGIPIVDTFTGLLAAFAIQTALVARERGQGGQLIDVAMLDATLVMMLAVINPLLMAGEKPQRTGNRGFSRAPTADTFATANGEITIGAVDDRHVEKLLKVLGLSALLEQPEFATRIARIENADAMQKSLGTVFKTRDAREWEAELQSVGVPAARVLTVEQAIKLDHLQERDVFLNLADGSKALNAGFCFAQNGPGTNQTAPDLGAQTEPILAQINQNSTGEKRRA
ncbi:MAG: crotonobetainyl-CoA:carnitine CoA-transferase CaiB-like acyl-CoA transferase [Halocynthiibacter sp.]